MSLSSMYMDTPTAEISGTIANLRKEEADRKSRNWKSAQDLLRGAAVDSIRDKYSDQISWDQGVQNADKVFKVQYDRMMSVDPQAAAQLREDYQAERTKRVNQEIADKYQGATSKVNADIQAIEQEIMRLESEVADEEAATRESARLEAEASKAAPLLPGLVPSVGPLSDQTPEAEPWSSPIDEFVPREQPPMRFGLRNLYTGGR